jgi:hypothetical protein
MFPACPQVRQYKLQEMFRAQLAENLKITNFTEGCLGDYLSADMVIIIIKVIRSE